MEEEEVVAALKRIMKRGSHGVCLKARGHCRNQGEAVQMLATAKIPVVTLVTDVGCPDRLAYVGMDNARAGRTAAYLIAKCLKEMPGTVLTSRSHEKFSGEEERELAFVTALAEFSPQLRVVSVRGGSGVDFETSRLMHATICDINDLRAVYSMGGGNRSILGALEERRLKADVFVAHDLDQENRELILKGRMDFVLHHDLKLDIRNAFNALLSFHRLSVEGGEAQLSSVQVVTPENVPA